MIPSIGLGILAFLIGSIPFAYLLVRLIYGVDIRKRGSGNPGASNVIREFGIVPGVLTLALDAAKGSLPILLFDFFVPEMDAVLAAYLRILIGVLAVLGHIYSPFLKGRGGKGIATFIGVFMVLFPLGLLTGFLIGLMAMSIYRWFSLGSLLGMFSLPLAYFTQTQQPLHPAELPLLYLILVALVLTIINHRENIKRILIGKEVQYNYSRKQTRN